MKNLLIGYYGFGNFGDDAMLRSITAYNVGRHTALCVAKMRPEVNAKIVMPTGRFLTSFFFHAIKAERVIWGGGTCFYGGTKNQLFLLTVVLLTRIARKRFLFYGVGVDPFSSKMAERVARLTIRMCNEIYARDKLSLEYLRKLKQHTKLVVDPFIALTLEGQQKKENLVLINLKLSFITEKNLAVLLSHLHNEFDRVIAISLNASDQGESEFLAYIKNQHPSVEVLPYSGLNSTLALFHSASSFIGYRLHGMICCMLSRTGFLAYEYQNKVRKASLELRIEQSRLITNFNDINIDLLRKPEEKGVINELNKRAIDEIKGI
jgi:polysaccharide pyruvyl transferase WcaK-like protein